jgi:hypothetical protein
VVPCFYLDSVFVAGWLLLRLAVGCFVILKVPYKRKDVVQAFCTLSVWSCEDLGFEMKFSLI